LPPVIAERRSGRSGIHSRWTGFPGILHNFPVLSGSSKESGGGSRSLRIEEIPPCTEKQESWRAEKPAIRMLGNLAEVNPAARVKGAIRTRSTLSAHFVRNRRVGQGERGTGGGGNYLTMRSTIRRAHSHSYRSRARVHSISCTQLRREWICASLRSGLTDRRHRDRGKTAGGIKAGAPTIVTRESSGIFYRGKRGIREIVSQITRTSTPREI